MSGGLVPYGSRALMRQVESAIAIEQVRGAVAGTRIRNIGVAAEWSMLHIEHLATIEEAAIRRSPLAERRLAYIVDRAADGMAHVIASLA